MSQTTLRLIEIFGNLIFKLKNDKMKLDKLIEFWQKEMTRQQEMSNDSKLTIWDKDHAITRTEVISNIIKDLEKLDGEDLKRDEKSCCDIPDGHFRPCHKHFIPCAKCEHYIEQK